MKTIITRLYADEPSARGVAMMLKRIGVPSYDMQVIVAKEGEGSEALQARIGRAETHESALPTYAGKVLDGYALLVVRATYKPLGAARIVRETTAKTAAIDVGAVVDDFTVRDVVDPAPRILKGHPRFLTILPEPGEMNHGPVTANLFRMLSAPKIRNSAIPGGRVMSRRFWPMKLLSYKPRSRPVISGGRFMSALFWPMPLLSHKKRRSSVIRGDARPLSDALGWPTTS